MTMHNKNISKRQKTDQRGIVAILVTMILMVVISLIVISFAKISRREQRNALDRQLSTQAFYAAESGINDARKVIDNWISTGQNAKLISYMDSCNGVGSFAAAAVPPGPVVNLGTPIIPGGNASYTCLFADLAPKTIVYTKSDQQHVLPIKDQSGAPISNIEIYFDDGSGGTSFTSCPSEHNNGPYSNCDSPILRLEMVKGSDLTINKVFFIYPSQSSGGTISYGTTTGGTAQADCSYVATNPNRCKIQVTNLSGNSYFLRLKGIYKSAAFTISANDGVAELVGAQILIDSTGKAEDVERRIQVRTRANNLSSDVPLYGLEGTGKICKKFYLTDTTAKDAGSCWGGPTPD